MTWIEVSWIAMAAASLTLGLIHGLVWLGHRKAVAHLLFVVLACSAATFAGCELVLMRSASPQDYAATLRWAHVPLAMVVLSMIGFVHFYFDAGRAWLALSACSLRLFALLPNFLTGVNVNFLEITAIKQLTLWGGVHVSTPVGVANPWAIVPQLGNLLLLAFVVDAAVALWRRGGREQRRRALLVGGSLAFCAAVVATLAALLVTGVLQVPTFVMPGIFVVVLAMAFELGAEVVAAAQMADRLQASEASFRAVVESVPSGILLVDRHGRIALTNGTASALFGYGRAALLGRSIDSLLPEYGARLAQPDRHGFAERPDTAGITTIAHRAGGGEFPVEALPRAVRTEAGPLTLVSVVDITERRRSEQAERRQRDELAHLSRVAVLGVLSGSLAHELNQPLTAILSNAQAAERYLNRSPPALDLVREIIGDIVRSNRRAADVIQRLRLLFRKDPVPHGAVDLSEVVADSLRLMRSDLLSRNVQAELAVADNLPPVHGDRVQLQQVLLNFLLNGCQAMEEVSGEHRLQVSASRTADGIEIAVSDTGPGFDPETLKRLFEPFVTTRVQGLGLGLAICKTIADAHGGRIWASNNADAGATLHFELPVHEEAVIR